MNEFSALEPYRYPSLSGDIERAYEVAGPVLRAAEARVAAYERRYRRIQLSIFYGGVVAVLLGGLALTGGGGGFLIAELCLTAAVGALAVASAHAGWHRHWQRELWSTEKLRAEPFRFIGRLGDYAASPDPLRLLQLRLEEITQEAGRLDRRG